MDLDFGAGVVGDVAGGEGDGAVGVDGGGEVGGAFPGDGFDEGSCGGVFEVGGVVGGAVAFVDGGRFECGGDCFEGKAGESHEFFDGGANEEFEADEGTDGVAGEAEDVASVAVVGILIDAEPEWLAGFELDLVEDFGDAEGFEGGWDEVEVACGDAAGEEEDVGLESGGDGGFEVGLGVFGDS